MEDDCACQVLYPQPSRRLRHFSATKTNPGKGSRNGKQTTTDGLIKQRSKLPSRNVEGRYLYISRGMRELRCSEVSCVRLFA